jgi:hypothetical protein
MTAVPGVAAKVRIAAAASAVAAAAIVAPATVANATPAAPLPTVGLGSTLGGDTISQCDPDVSVCAPLAAVGSSSVAIVQTPLFWFGPANPNFQPLFGITFPNFFGLDFEACVLGGAVHLSPYGGGFVGVGRGC